MTLEELMCELDNDNEKIFIIFDGSTGDLWPYIKLAQSLRQVNL